MTKAKTAVFICQAVDQNDPVLAGTLSWIKNWADNYKDGKLLVLSLRVGEYDLPGNVEICRIGSKNKAKTLLNFYKEILKRIWRINYFFIYMGGVYPLLLLPFKIFWRKSIYQWKAHPRVSLLMRFSAYFCDNLVFTSAQAAFPINLKKVKQVGQGIDTEKFFKKNVAKTEDVIVVGRISPVKRLEKAIELIAEHNKFFRTEAKLNIYGPVLEKDKLYAKSLKELTKKINAESWVNFCGPVNQRELPEILNKHKVFISFNAGAADRAVIEAMACGLPVLTPNKSISELLTTNLRSSLIVSDNNIQGQAERLNYFLSAPRLEYEQTSNKLEELIKKNYNTQGLIKKITTLIEEHNRRKKTFLRRAVKQTLVVAGYFLKKVFHPLKKERRIICLHEIKDSREFFLKIKGLKDNYEIVSLEDLLRNEPLSLKKTKVAITFDDGFEDWHTIAAPVLKELSVPATFFICSGFIGLSGSKAKDFCRDNLNRKQTLKPLAVDQLRELADNPLFEIGCHGKLHLDLGIVNEQSVLEEEIVGSKNQIEQWTGRPARWFAYPFGDYENIPTAAWRIFEKSGIEGAFTFVPAAWNQRGHKYLLPRVGLNIFDNFFVWRAYLGGGGDWLAKLAVRNSLSRLVQKTIIFLGKNKYNRPLNPDVSEKFKVIKELGAVKVIGYSFGWFPRFFKQEANFYLFPRLPFVPLRRFVMFLVSLKISLLLTWRGRQTVIIAQDPYEGFAGALAKTISGYFGKKVKLIVENHGDFEKAVFLSNRFFLAGLYKRLMAVFAEFSLKRADGLRAVSDETARQLKKIAGEKNIIKFPAWTNIDLFLKEGEKKNKRTKDILFVGSLSHLKGVHFLIEAFGKISAGYPESNLIVVGAAANKKYAADLRRQAEDLNLAEKVFFKEFMSQTELAKLMGQSSVLVLPSLSEGLGRVIIEAMAVGLPVIGSNVGGIPDLIINNRTGFLVMAGDAEALADKIGVLLKNAAMAEEMGESGKQRAKELFSKDAYKESYLKLINNVFSG